MLLYQQEFVSNRRLRTTNSVGPCGRVLLGLIKELGSTPNRWAALPLSYAGVVDRFHMYFSTIIIKNPYFIPRESWSVSDILVEALKMDQLVRRITVVLVNESKHVVVELKESCRFAPRGIYSYKIELAPLSHRNIPATFFHRWAIDSSRPTAVKIFVDGVYSNVALTPRDFIRCFCIIVRVDENGEVRVGGIKATTWPDHLRRIWYIILYYIILYVSST